MSNSSYRPKKRPYMDRSVNQRPKQKRYLIVCQGEKTEPNYFIGFRTARVVIQVNRAARHPGRVVEKAIQLRDDHIDSFDQVWCVFDCDDTPAQDFNAALDLAIANGILVAYSNEAFELWYLLHFDYVNTAISRSQYIRILETRLHRAYNKNDPSMYAVLVSRQLEAIIKAKRLLQSYAEPDPYRDNPSTTVHILVEELNRFRQR